MDFKEIQELIKLINKSNITEFKYALGDFKLTIRSKDSENIVQQVIHQAAPVAIAAPVAASAPVAIAAAPAPAATPAAPAPAPNAGLLEIKSPIVGTFYRSASPEKGPYVKVGDKVSAGSTVCIVEAMKLFNEIESDVTGTIVKVMIEDMSPVEYDQVLFLVDPKG
ncbi:MAG: acetyl-CoA carboxylase biotin carboxyl carrier protein [Bacteroidota bacterium]|jgi:acetyl-CoA carboxylase biotin carboxyl carrier protein